VSLADSIRAAALKTARDQRQTAHAATNFITRFPPFPDLQRST